MRRRLPLLFVLLAAGAFLVTPHRHRPGEAHAHWPEDHGPHEEHGAHVHAEEVARELAAPAEGVAEVGVEEPPVEPYDALVSRVRSGRGDAAARLAREDPGALEARMIGHMESIFARWYGTTWGLGAPQTKVPGEGKINCGMFVARTLVDAGFVVEASKLQRQPAELIIKSLAPRSTIKRWRNEPMETFIADMKEMGPGLYVIGLDFHVGYVLVREDLDVRFIHASYVTHTVLDEPAADAAPIVTSTYRVVGKILQQELLEKWAGEERVAVRGSW